MNDADPERLNEIATAFRQQAQGCAGSGSAIYADLLARAAEDIAQGGPLRELVEQFRGHPVLDALAMRVMGAIHRRVLAGQAPELAAYYPSVGGSFEAEGAWRALRALVASDVAGLRVELLPVQTNEVMRCCALLGGFLRVAARFELPLRLLEVGSSAGLLLGFDRYHYELGDQFRYEPGSPADQRIDQRNDRQDDRQEGRAVPPLLLHCDWRGDPPELDAPLRVAAREGCDPRPIDVCSAEERLRLEPFVWADQVERLERLRTAMALTAADPPRLDEEPAETWLPRHLALPAEGQATVVFHSVVWWYLSREERADIVATIEAAGRLATATRPLAWLRLEGSNLDYAEVRLRCWPEGGDQLLGHSHWHGAWVAWGEAAEPTANQPSARTRA